MGNEFEVWSWEDISLPNKEQHLSYIKKYNGDDFNEAVDIARALKKAGAGCVKIMWR